MAKILSVADMKKLAYVVLLASLSGQVMASGIPTVDVAAIAKTVEEGLTRAQEAANQLVANISTTKATATPANHFQL